MGAGCVGVHTGRYRKTQGYGELMGWDALLEIINKLLPNRREAQVDELNRLNVEFQKALQEGRTTDAAKLNKKMEMLRQKVKASNE
jgi:hypothetical protein